MAPKTEGKIVNALEPDEEEEYYDEEVENEDDIKKIKILNLKIQDTFIQMNLN